MVVKADELLAAAIKLTDETAPLNPKLLRLNSRRKSLPSRRLSKMSSARSRYGSRG